MPEAENDELPQAVTLRPSWLSSIAVGPVIVVVLVLLALAMGQDVLQAVVFGIVFGIVFALMDHARRVELSPAGATANDVWRKRSVARSDVRAVDKGPWWSGGMKLSTDTGDFWLRVGDRPLGIVSDERLAVVADWAAARETGASS